MSYPRPLSAPGWEPLVRWTVVGVPVIGIAGAGKSGKTTLLEGLIPRLRQRGLVVGVLKHSGHALSFDAAGRDTDRLYAAGASIVQAHDDEQWFARRRESGLLWRRALATVPADLDVLLVEGHKRAIIPKVWVSGDRDSDLGAIEGIVARVKAGALVEADSVVTSLLEDAWRARPWGVVSIGASHEMPVPVRFGDDRAAATLPPVPGVPWPLSAVLSAMRWLPDRAWIVASDAARNPASDAATDALLSSRRSGQWAVASASGESTASPPLLLEPQLHPSAERLAAALARPGPRTLQALLDIARQPR